MVKRSLADCTGFVGEKHVFGGIAPHMLKSIDPILAPDLLWLLASMGHGDDLVVVDADHPATHIARTTSSQRSLELPLMPLSTITDDMPPATSTKFSCAAADRITPTSQIT